METNGDTSVFVIEDHEVSRLGMRILIENTAGLRWAGEAADGQNGVKRVLEIKPDVVLMDVGLPLVDGISATRQIKQNLPGVRVIMFTSHLADDDIFAAFIAGADGYCLKDAPTTILLAAIQSVAEGAIWLDPGIASRVLAISRQASGRNAPPSAVKEEPAAVVSSLTERELEVLRLVVDGLGNQEIAERLVVSIETVKSHMRHIMEKLLVSDRTQAAVKALRIGLV